MTYDYVNNEQMATLQRDATHLEAARVQRVRVAAYSAMQPDQARDFVERVGAWRLHDEIIAAGPSTAPVREEIERRAAEVKANRLRAEQTQREGAGALPGSARYSRAFAAAREVQAYLEMEASYAEVLLRPWPSDEAVQAGVAAVARHTLVSIRQQLSAKAYEKMLGAQQHALSVLHELDAFDRVARSFTVAAGRDLDVASWNTDDVAALRHVAALEFVRTGAPASAA